MDAEQLRDYCLSLPGVTESMKWGDHLCFCVAEKIFLIVGLDNHPVTASFKVTAQDFAELSASPGFSQAPYLARGQWVLLKDIELLSDAAWKKYAAQSYALVKAKLPKKLQQQLEPK